MISDICRTGRHYDDPFVTPSSEPAAPQMASTNNVLAPNSKTTACDVAYRKIGLMGESVMAILLWHLPLVVLFEWWVVSVRGLMLQVPGNFTNSCHREEALTWLAYRMRRQMLPIRNALVTGRQCLGGY